jgi:hypothetical protein
MGAKRSRRREAVTGSRVQEQRGGNGDGKGKKVRRITGIAFIAIKLNGLSWGKGG